MLIGFPHPVWKSVYGVDKFRVNLKNRTVFDMSESNNVESVSAHCAVSIDDKDRETNL